MKTGLTRLLGIAYSIIHASIGSATNAKLASEEDTVYTEGLFHKEWENTPYRVLRNSTLVAWNNTGKA